jgi:membrane-associated phospholipid phosphatase
MFLRIGRHNLNEPSARTPAFRGPWLVGSTSASRVLLVLLILGSIPLAAQTSTTPPPSNSLSFPSGHSASAFATAGVLQRHYGWEVGVPAAVVAAYVATARVHDNKHYLSDVIFGGTMGIAAERTVTLHAGRYGMVLTPLAGGGRAGVLAIVRAR